MNADLVNAFITSTYLVLETNAQAKLKPFKPFLKNDLVAQGSISGVLDIDGEMKGSVAITFTKECILKLISTWFMDEMTELNDEIEDALGELSGQVAGQANQKFPEYDKDLKATFNKVIMTENHTIAHVPNRPVLALPFHADDFRFVIEVCFDE